MSKYSIGIDLGGMSAKAGLVSKGLLTAVKKCATRAEDPASVTAAALCGLVEEIIAETGIPRAETVVGVGSPGTIDSASGTVVRWTNFHWENVPLGKMMEERLGVRVFVTNDANAAALGEAVYGGGKGCTDSVLITLGTGVGGGIIMNGELVEGARSAGGELGHMVIKTGGILCSCGRRGCFECYSSATALIRETRKAMKKHPESAMWSGVKSESEATGLTAFAAARKGDAAAKRVVSSYVKNLGEGVVNVVNILRPETVIIGGGVSNEGENLLEPLRKFVYERIYASKEYAPLSIVKAELGNDAGIYGAAELARRKAGKK